MTTAKIGLRAAEWISFMGIVGSVFVGFAGLQEPINPFQQEKGLESLFTFLAIFTFACSMDRMSEK